MKRGPAQSRERGDVGSRAVGELAKAGLIRYFDAGAVGDVERTVCPSLGY